MLGTKEIKRRIRSVISIQQITRAMQMIAVSRLKKAEDRLRSARPFAEKIQEFMETLAPSLTSIRHPLLVKREVKSIGLVLITSDKGLCGGYNANVLNHTREFIEKHPDKAIRLILDRQEGFDSYRRKVFPDRLQTPPDLQGDHPPGGERDYRSDRQRVLKKADTMRWISSIPAINRP